MEVRMYCTFCGSKQCKGVCIFSDTGKKRIVEMLERVFLEYSTFNKSYVFVPFDTWDGWAIENDMPTQADLKVLYPEEDLESLLFMVLDGLELSPELQSYYSEPFDAEHIEAEGFSEFNENFTFDAKSLTREDVLRYNKQPVNKLPRPNYVKLNIERINNE
jgi:hypothetical protein